MMLQETRRRSGPMLAPPLTIAVPARPRAGRTATRSARDVLGGLLTRRSQAIMLVGAVVASALAFALVPPVQAEFRQATEVVGSGDQARIGDYLRAYGAWGPVISLALMVGQAIVAPIPGSLVVFANGIAFGTFWGTVLSVVGQTLAAMVCFWIARVLGRGPVEAMVGRFGLDSLDHWFGKWGAPSIVLLRLVPGVAFDGVSFGAGLLNIRFRTFVIATVVGVLPQSLFYTWLIQRYPGFAVGMTVVALAVFAGTALIGIVTGLRHRRRGTSPDSSTSQPGVGVDASTVARQAVASRTGALTSQASVGTSRRSSPAMPASRTRT